MARIMYFGCGPQGKRRQPQHVLRALATAIVLLGVGSRSLASEPAAKPNTTSGTTSAAARQEAIESIPLDKLDRHAQAKIKGVLANVSIFRRLPVRVVDCDPELYQFLARHPDVVVSIWDALKLTQLDLRQTAPDKFRAVESDGTTVTFEYLLKSHDTHIVYAEGTYTGALLTRPVKGSCLCILKSGYVRETDGRYYVTSRLDTFLNVEPGAIELVAKTLQPIAGHVADNNFIQTVAFLGSLSKTAEVNPSGVERLAARLPGVQAEIREEFAAVAAKVAEKAAAVERRLPTPLAAGRTATTTR